MQCIRCGKEMFTSSSNGDNICSECRNSDNNPHIYIPNNCDIPMPQGFGKQEGWICPVCGRGVSPWVDYCPCTRDAKITYGTTTGIIDEELKKLFEQNDIRVAEITDFNKAYGE